MQANLPRANVSIDKQKTSIGKTRITLQGFVKQNRANQDRIFYIDDLYKYVRENHDEIVKTEYLSWNPKYKSVKKLIKTAGGRGKSAKGSKKSSKKSGEDFPILALFAVFDGHGGFLAANFCVEVLVHELMLIPEFHDKDYSKALSLVTENLHNSLFEWPEFVPEGAQPYTSGCTASIVLVTSTHTYCASVGDSPIILCSTDGKISCALEPHDIRNMECNRRVLASGISISCGKGLALETIFNPCKLPILYPNFARIGCGLNVLGGIGDSIFDPRLFNPLIDIIAKVASSSSIEEDSDESAKDDSEMDDSEMDDDSDNVKTTKVVVPMMISELAQLKKEIEKSSSPCSKQVNLDTFFTLYIRKLLQSCKPWTRPEFKQGKLKIDPLIRKASVKQVSNKSIRGFILCSDGLVDSRSVENKSEFSEMFSGSFKSCFKSLKRMFVLTDDRSAFLCWYKRSTDSNQCVSSKTSAVSRKNPKEEQVPRGKTKKVFTCM